jgi:hypothetical protein
MLDGQFVSAVGELLTPTAGTELMAPLLYSLVRSTRARCVVEVGTGYTTPFILRALEDNRSDFHRELDALKRKSKDLVDPGWRALVTAKVFRNHQRFFGDSMEEKRWIAAEPYAADPSHYLRGYDPHLYAFDDYTWPLGTAPMVLEVVDKLGLRDKLTFIQSDPSGQKDRIAKEHLPIDLAWNDASNYWSFFNEYWELLNPDGGLLLLHNTVNSSSLGNSIILKNLMLKHFSSPIDYEILSIVEPHKMNQNSFTMIRKTAGFRDHYLQYRGREIRQNVERLLAGESSSAREDDD